MLGQFKYIKGEMAKHQLSQYWQQRYKQNVCEWFEWLATPNQIASAIGQHVRKEADVLELGCGTSNFAQKLVSMGVGSVTCLDFSKEVVRNRQKHAKEGISYQVANLLQPLPFEESHFDLIIEKNTLDCLFCHDDFPPKILACMAECHRVLKPGGKVVSISQGRPKHRRFFYRNKLAPFECESVALEGSKEGQPQFYVYVLTKEGESGEVGAIIREEEPEEEAAGEEQEKAEEQQDNESEENDPPKEQEQQEESPNKNEEEQEQTPKQPEQNDQPDYGDDDFDGIEESNEAAQ